MQNTVGTKLRKLREVKGLSQHELAKRLGYSSNSYVSDMEKGLFVPAEDKLDKIAHALELPLDVIKEVVLEAKIEGLGITEPAFVSLFKDFPSLSRQDKKEIVRAYYKVRSSRNHNDEEGYPGGEDDR